MPCIVNLKRAAELTGLSQYELRIGAKAGRYPHTRAGNPVKGKLLFDIDLLTDYIRQTMLAACRQEPETEQYGVLRKIKG